MKPIKKVPPGQLNTKLPPLAEAASLTLMPELEQDTRRSREAPLYFSHVSSNFSLSICHCARLPSVREDIGQMTPCSPITLWQKLGSCFWVGFSIGLQLRLIDLCCQKKTHPSPAYRPQTSCLSPCMAMKHWSFNFSSNEEVAFWSWPVASHPLLPPSPLLHEPLGLSSAQHTGE